MNLIYKFILDRYKIVWSFYGLFFAITNAFQKVPQNIDYLFLGHDVHRTAKKFGKLYTPLIDPIIEELSEDHRCLTLATPFSQHFGHSCFNDVRMHNSVVIGALIKRVIIAVLGSKRSIKKDPLVLAYKSLLLKIRPKIVIGIQPSVEFCVAAKQLGIVTFDMQHGVISDVNYYSVVKREKINQQGWPDNILCWDQESAQRVERITNGNCCPWVIGNPSYHSKYGAILHELDDSSSRTEQKDFKMEILVTATHHDPGVFFKDKIYQTFGIPYQLIDLIKKTPDIFWRIRLHPVVVRFDFDRINLLLQNEFKQCGNVGWSKYSKVPFGKALKGCTGHITDVSASALDATVNSVPTLLVGAAYTSGAEKAEQYFSEHIAAGHMKFIRGTEFSVDSLNFFKFQASSARNKKDKYENENNFLKFIAQIKNEDIPFLGTQ